MNWLANVEAAIEAWKTVPPQQVDVGVWACGSVHCFGGWLPYFEHFRELGVHPANDGVPTFATKTERLFGASVSEHLFGVDLFYTYDLDEYGTDWQVIMRRLETRRKGLKHGNA